MKMLFFEITFEQEEILRKAFAHDELFFFSSPLTKNNIPQQAHDADIISVFVFSMLSKEVLACFPTLKAVFSRTTGSDHLDCHALQERSIKVFTLPCYATQSVAEYTFALMLTIMRKVLPLRDLTKEQKNYEVLCGSELAYKTLGIIGLGNIGSAVANIAQGFSMKVIAYDPCKTSAEGVELTSLQELLPTADIITVHVPLNEQTKHMLNAQTLAHCKRGFFLINTARGAIIETSALIELLEKDHVGGIALDVLEEEFFTFHRSSLMHASHLSKETYKTVCQNSYLMNHPRVFVSYHNAFNTHESQQRALQETIECIKDWKKALDR